MDCATELCRKCLGTLYTENVEACFEPALQFTPTTQQGVYTVQVPIGDIPTFVTVLGVHTHSFWVNKSATREKEHSAKGQPQEPEDETSHTQHKRVRYKCFRRSHCRRPSAKETSENAQGGETKKQSREFRTTIKCDCPAYTSTELTNLATRRYSLPVTLSSRDWHPARPTATSSIAGCTC
eukprot:1186015-Prorocentrum_minimum.AAC.2